MIILDEQLLGRNLEVEIGSRYRGSVRFITDLRPNTVIKDEAIPFLLRQQRQPTFVTINERDFWQRIMIDHRFCVVCFAIPDSQADAIPALLRRLLQNRRAKAQAVYGWDEARHRKPMMITDMHSFALAFYPVIRYTGCMAELLKTGYHYRLHLTKGQQRLLERQLEECRWVYNQTLAARRDAWEQHQETIGLYDTQAMLPDWKAERRLLKLVHSQVLQNVQVRVDLAFKAFFRRVKAGEDPGYPRFKQFGRYDSMTYPQYGNGARLQGKRLILSKIGAVLINLHRPLEGRIKTVTLRRSSTGKWFVAFAVERPIQQSESVPEAAVGVDVGLEKFATLSTGETIDNPRFFRGDEGDLARAQRRLSEQPKGTPQRARRRKIVARIHERIANRRKNFAHQQSRKLVKGFGLIVFEDLSITRMIKNHCLAKSIADAAWNQLASYTQYKAEEAGRAYIEIDPRQTSQRCSRCGAVVKKDLSTRVHQCPHCGLEIDRDLNAAYNILRLGLQSQGRMLQEAQVLLPWE
jgi:putative transposase